MDNKADAKAGRERLKDKRLEGWQSQRLQAAASGGDGAGAGAHAAGNRGGSGRASMHRDALGWSCCAVAAWRRCRHRDAKAKAPGAGSTRPRRRKLRGEGLLKRY